MKIRKIAAEEEVLTFNEQYLDDIENTAYHCGYNMEQDNDGQYVFTAKSNQDHMPVVTAVPEEEGGKLWLNPSISFPEKMVSDGTEFADSFESWLSDWVNAGKLCTYLNKTPFDPSRYSEED